MERKRTSSVLALIARITIFSLSTKAVAGLVGYDCEDNDSVIASYSLVDKEECLFSKEQENTQKVNLQLLQPRTTLSYNFLACHVEYRQTVFGCGRSSYIYLQQNHLSSGVEDISETECRKMINSRSYTAPNFNVINGLIPNQTVQTTVVIAGAVDESGWCEAGTFSQIGKPDVSGVVIREYEISIASGVAQLDISSGLLILPGKIGCKANNNFCYSAELGFVYMEENTKLTCDNKKYLALYQGLGTISYNKDQEPKTVMVEEEDIAFALELEGTIRECGHNIQRTEHPKLYIEFESPEGFNRDVESVNGADLSLVSYINSKFVYMDHKIKSQVNDLYTILQQKRCQLEQETIKNRLSLAETNPDQFAYNMNNNIPGTTAIIKGEVVYLIKCKEKSVARRNTSAVCYNEIPVYYNEKPFFLTAKNRLLIQSGNQIECSTVLPSGYKVGSEWLAFTPKFTRIVTPKTMSLNISGQYEYILNPNLIKAGIYTHGDTESFQRSLILPAESRAKIHTLVNLYSGMSIQHQGGSVWNLMTPNDLKKIGSRMLSAFLGTFREIGVWSSAVIGIVSILSFIKAIISCSVRTVSTLCTTGCSTMLLVSWIPGANWILTMMQLKKKRTLADEILDLPADDLKKIWIQLKQVAEDFEDEEYPIGKI